MYIYVLGSNTYGNHMIRNVIDPLVMNMILNNQLTLYLYLHSYTLPLVAVHDVMLGIKWISPPGLNKVNQFIFLFNIFDNG